MIYRYRIEFVEEVEDEDTKISVGFCEASGYTDAINKLIEHFGERNIVSFKNLKLIGDHNIIELASGSERADCLRQAEHILDEYEKNFIW